MKLIIFLTASLLCLASVYACPAGTTVGTGQVDGKSICFIEGSYLNTNLVLTADTAWVLKGDVRIGGDKKDNSTLTLEAGTVVYGSPQSFITITRDSKIFANGTQNKPVVFTALERVNPTAGYWGGLVITGNARINNCGAGVCEGFIEGVASDQAPKYGGSNDDDSSGSMEYMRVEYAGYTFGTDSELNAITLYAVGRGTKIENIEAYKGADDGIELFGGTVNLKYVVSIDNDDDGFDWDQGWSGAAQFVYIVLENASEKDPNGIEGDNFRDNHTATPRSNPVMSNVTIIAKNGNPKLLNGIMLRRGTGAQIYNSIVSGNFQNCLNIDDEETFKNGGVVSGGTVKQTGLVMQNTILQCNNVSILEDAAKDLWSITKWFNESERNNFVMVSTDKVLDDAMPVDGSAALDTGMTPPEDMFPGNYEFDGVDYVGAFSPVENNWTEGWIVK
ncbi:hypothetical protein K2X05_10530 [bacterium]|nr:hypothetical protein [bacterium]